MTAKIQHIIETSNFFSSIQKKFVTLHPEKSKNGHDPSNPLNLSNLLNLLNLLNLSNPLNLLNPL